MQESDNMKDISAWASAYKDAKAEDVIRAVAERFGAGNVALASSFGVEDQALTHIVMASFPDIRIFTIDTGRLPEETYDCMQKTSEKYSFKYEVLKPDPEDIARLIGSHGPNLFYESVELRKECCRVRKVVPLKRKLGTLSAWICGLRRAQGVTRADVATIEWDQANGLVKASPLAGWSDQEVWDFIKKNKIPYNALQDKGYPSIGCEPCTRAVKPGEDIRSGRWWWESPEHKECGLHNRERRKG